MHELLRLESLHCCLLIEFEAGRIPLWRHFGAKLASTHLCNAWPAANLRRQAPGSMNRLDGTPVFAGFGNGLSSNPALLAHRDGLDSIQELIAVSYTINATPEQQTLVLHLADDTTQTAAALRVTLTLCLHHASDMLSLHSQLHNTGQHTLQVDKLAAGTVPMAAAFSEVGHFSGQWAHEFQWQRQAISATGWQQQNRRGRTSQEAPPACFGLTAYTADSRGETIAAQLAHSSNHFFSLDRQDDGSLLLQAGPWFAPGEVRLEPGQSLTTPLLHVTWTAGGINAASSNFHAFIRQQVVRWPGGQMASRPVHLNTWEAVYFDHDEATLRDLATQAAALGVERFVLDDGWFAGRSNDHSSLGDWWPDPLKYPHGLMPLIDHVLSLGMAFGLWVEPEMVNPDSDLYRQYPHWALQSAGRSLQLGRNQLVLDLSRPEVADYLFDKLDALLANHPITYLKWDMNRDLAQAENAQGRMAYQAQVPALHTLLERLRLAHPAVEIESCSSGAGRADLGILRHTHRLWTSDNNDAVSRVAIQSSAARLFPLELLGSHVGPAPAHATGRSQGMDFRCAVAVFGHMGVEADIRKLNASDQQTLARWIALYKSWRAVLHTGQFHQGNTANGVWWLVQTEKACLLGVFTLHTPASPHHAPLLLPGLSGLGLWRVKLCGWAGQERARGDATMAWREALQGEGVLHSADELRHIGLSLPNMNAESALIFLLSN